MATVTTTATHMFCAGTEITGTASTAFTYSTVNMMMGIPTVTASTTANAAVCASGS